MTEKACQPNMKRHRAEQDGDRGELWSLAFESLYYGPFRLEWLLDQFEWRMREGDQI
ncbi:hypothetical protein [Actibacterium ureilyticum]|uniref:hypothetical protein n=1 Tax=Actibacterium ureilyticum TaxID=1590614 RepID=UPI0015959E35|nr:hypothetical protein [Actibacterium ureilyticum]